MSSTEKAGGIILSVYFCVLTAAMTFYAPSGYAELGDAKFTAYRLISILFAAVLLVTALIRAFRHIRDEGGSFHIIPADIFVLVYINFIALSLCFSVDRNESFWGTNGWRMGALTQLLFLLGYFFARIFSIRPKPVFVITGLIAGLEAVICLLDRLGIYIFDYMGIDPIFIGTVGNIDWYCCYLAVAFPAVLGVLILKCRDGKSPALLFLSGVLLVLNIAVILTQGADGGFLVLGVSILSGLAMTKGESRAWKTVSLLAQLLLILMAAAFAALILMYSDMETWARPVNSLFHMNIIHDDFGSGRGIIWRISWDIFRDLPTLRKLLGVGPDAFAAYLCTLPDALEQIYSWFGIARLTNPHTELLNILLNEGLLAMVSYLLFVISAFCALVKKMRRGDGGLSFIAILVLITLSAEQAITFRSVMSTPFMLILIGSALHEGQELRYDASPE